MTATGAGHPHIDARSLAIAKLVFDSLSEGTGSQLQSNQSFTSSSIQYSSKV